MKKIILPTVIGVLSIILGLGIGYVVFGDQKDKCEESKIEKLECPKNEENIEESTECSTDEETVEEIENINTKYDAESIITIKLMNKIQNYNMLDAFGKDIKDLSNEEILMFALSKIGYKEEIKLSEIEKVISEYLDVTFTSTDIPCQMGCEALLYIYDSKNKIFKLNEEHGGHGGTIVPNNVIERFHTLKTTDNKYTITVYKAYSNISDIGPGETSYYKTYEEVEDLAKGNRNVKALFKVEYDEDLKVTTNILEEFRKIPNSSLTKVTYTFIKDGENFILSELNIN